MFRLNRGRIIGLLLSTFIIYFLFLSSANTNSEFRKRTEDGLSRRHGVLQGELSDEAFRAETNKRLNDILSSKDGKSGQKPLRASDEGAGPAPVKPKTSPKLKPTEEETYNGDDGVDKFTGVAGRKTMQKPKDKPRYPVDKSDEKQESLKKTSSDDDDEDKKSEPTKPKIPSDPGKDLAREKLQEYMKKPLIIFSKSYCPHSKRAKQLLLEMYTIVPTPLVVELDQLTERVPHPSSGDEDDDEDDNPRPQPTLGQKIQELLAEITSRRTVPNIVVGTTSIGGNDLIWAMHEQGTLAEKIKELGGRRIVSVEPVVEEAEDKKE